MRFLECNCCEQIFGKIENLRQHLQEVQDNPEKQEKPYQCNLCNIKFARKDMLDVHTASREHHDKALTSNFKKCKKRALLFLCVEQAEEASEELEFFPEDLVAYRRAGDDLLKLEANKTKTEEDYAAEFALYMKARPLEALKLWPLTLSGFTKLEEKSKQEKI